mmetsp:Transcript_12758/g.40458  ORF Transcript_12758/g.40458 Transcript_12758/m.40458 type:complete len:206 (-) Transcript_12758:52-669(-)
MSIVAMSWFAGITARIIVRSCARYDSISVLTSSTTLLDCPETAVRTMPGRSSSVRSGTSGEVRLITMLSLENPLLVSEHSTCVSCSIAAHSDASSLTSPAADGCGPCQLTLAFADHGLPAAPRFMISCVAHRVTSPEPRGNGTPEIISSTELFPLLWSPITAICGKGKSCCTPCALNVSIKSMNGRAAADSVDMLSTFEPPSSID